MPPHTCPHCSWKEAYEDVLRKKQEWADIATRLQSQNDELKAEIEELKAALARNSAGIHTSNPYVIYNI